MTFLKSPNFLSNFAIAGGFNKYYFSLKYVFLKIIKVAHLFKSNKYKN